MSEVRFDEEVRDETRDVDTTGSEFCHILDASDKNYCGYVGSTEATCQPYNGEAICPSCGKANCPTCTVMASLNDRLVDE